MKVSLRLTGLLIVIMYAAACSRTRWYAMPEQRPSFEGLLAHIARVVDMADPDADVRIVRDIMPKTDTSWRWTGQRPAIKIRARVNHNVKYTIDFTLPDVTFKDTGPVNIAFTINDRQLDRVHYIKSGYQHFEKDVPADWLPIDAEVIVGAEIDKMWTSPGDDKMFGFILTQIGLKQ